jgi:lysophospholipase L1-like esterase
MKPARFAFVLFIVVLSSTTSLSAAEQAPGRAYLAVGDSISFGFINQAGFEYVNPDNFIGFPTYVGRAMKLNTSNAACPGETTGSFLSSSAPDGGCRTYRASVPLHVSYSSTQLDYAVSFLKSHPGTRLVTVGLGANDVLLLRNTCSGDSACIAAGLPQVLASVAANLQVILGDLRATGYGGIIIVVNYYSLDYSDPTETAITSALNQALATASGQPGTVVADVFSAFQAATVPVGGHTCNAGLLKASPQDEFTCDIHPSQSGQGLIARTVAQTFAAAEEHAH